MERGKEGSAAMMIAIDGPAASGKGSIARRVSERYGCPYMDTGLLYRYLAYAVLSEGGDLRDVSVVSEYARKMMPQDPHRVEESRLRGSAMGESASIVAGFGPVRAVLMKMQREFALQLGGAVLDGRDIGTVICPDAEVKLFVTADLDVRAHRRWLELVRCGEDKSLEDVREELRIRDDRDRQREMSPLCPAPDTCLLDTTGSSIDDAFRAAVAAVDGVLARRGS